MRVAVSLLRYLALALFAAGLLFNGWLVPRILPAELFADSTVARLRTTQLGLGVLALASFVVAAVVARAERGSHPSLPRPAAKLLLVAFAVVLPLGLAELLLRPFTVVGEASKTTVFVPDRELGWRLRPGADDMWGGVRVQINGKGLRGPEVDYEKDPAVQRLLYLGDSVAFGYGLGCHELTFPHRAEPLIEERLGREVETVNAGVGGYSPWQEARYLEREGLRYDPDLVLVCFVLNDVTAKFELRRFGGTGEGYQLTSSSRHPTLERLYQVSSLAHRLRQLGGRIAFGPDVQAGAAEEEALRVLTLMAEPESERVRQAWEVTLASLDRLFAACEERSVPAVLVVFPYAFQLDLQRGRARATGPQRILKEYGAERGVPVIDLLPPMRERMELEGFSSRTWFLDNNHLTARGHGVVARLLAEELSALDP